MIILFEKYSVIESNNFAMSDLAKRYSCRLFRLFAIYQLNLINYFEFCSNKITQSLTLNSKLTER